MNATKILFLKMLRSDIKRATYAKMGISSETSSGDELLAGQTINRSVIESFSSFRLMNTEERSIVNSILETSKKKDASDSTVSNERGRALIKQFDSLVPKDYSYDVEYKDAA